APRPPLFPSTTLFRSVAYGTPLIVAMLFHQGPLVTILSALVINLGFGAAGGILGVGLINRIGARRMTIIGFAIQAASLLLLAVRSEEHTSELQSRENL